MRRTSRRSLRICAALVPLVLACARRDADTATIRGAGSAVASPVPAALATTLDTARVRWEVPECTDSVETRAFACSFGTARRAGDTLFIRPTSGDEKQWRTIRERGEVMSSVSYRGRIGPAGNHLVAAQGYETYPAWLLVDARTGNELLLVDEPVPSPDSARFVTASTEGWDNCVERNQPILQIYRWTDALPELEWQLISFDCRKDSGWGATDPHWRGPDTLVLTRRDRVVTPDATGRMISSPAGTRPILVVRDSAGWRLVDRPRL